MAIFGKRDHPPFYEELEKFVQVVGDFLRAKRTKSPNL
jgi:hypothetical protein